MSAYSALGYKAISRSLVDTHMQPLESQSVCLKPMELLFLLESLKRSLPKGHFGFVSVIFFIIIFLNYYLEGKN